MLEVFELQISQILKVPCLICYSSLLQRYDYGIFFNNLIRLIDIFAKYLGKTQYMTFGFDSVFCYCTSFRKLPIFKRNKHNGHETPTL